MGLQVAAFASGQLQLRSEPSPCAPADLRFLSDIEACVTLTEGRYHQVRRMFAARGAQVVALTRLSFGELELAELGLQEGAWKHLPLDTFAR